MNYLLPKRHPLRQVTQIALPVQFTDPETGAVLIELDSTSGGGILRLFNRRGSVAVQIGCADAELGYTEVSIFRPGVDSAVISLVTDDLNSEVRVGCGDSDGPTVSMLASPRSSHVEIARTSEEFRTLAHV